MLMRSFSLMLLMLSLTGCPRSHETPSAPPSPAVMHGDTQTRTTAPFTRVQVDGNIDVTLYTGDLHPRVILHGDPRSMPDVEVTVRDGLLHINEGKGYPHFGRVRAEIRAHYLSSFGYRGDGAVTGNNLQSRMLDLTINNKSKTILQGNIALRKLEVDGSGLTQISGISGQMCQIKLKSKAHVELAGVVDVTSLHIEGNSWLSLYWVKSRELRIRARDHAFIQLAGVAELLDVELWDDAHFNGRYLRGMRVFAKTHDNSVADISVIKTQHTLASDSSNIYFHNLPDMKADFMAYNGAVLDMREWDPASLQEYTRYNR